MLVLLVLTSCTAVRDASLPALELAVPGDVSQKATESRLSLGFFRVRKAVAYAEGEKGEVIIEVDDRDVDRWIRALNSRMDKRLLLLMNGRIVQDFTVISEMSPAPTSLSFETFEEAQSLARELTGSERR